MTDKDPMTIHWEEHKAQVAADKSQRRQAAIDDFDAARRLADESDLRLRACVNKDVSGLCSHYQLRSTNPKWLLNIYPGNRRLYWDPNLKGPFLYIDKTWSLRSVVVAAITANQELRRRKRAQKQRS